MTSSQGQERRAKRSRILRSIFGRAPRDTSASYQRPAGMQNRLSDASVLKHGQTKPAGWRDVTAQLTRAALAESLCSRFFARGNDLAVATHGSAPQAVFITAGQRLQALSNDAEQNNADHQSLAAVLEASACGTGSHEAQDAERAGATLQSHLTAEAA